MSVADTIIRMMKAVGADSEAELLRKAGLSSGASAQWKARGIVSDKSIMRISRLSGYSPDWIKDGTGPMRPEKNTAPVEQVAEPTETPYRPRDALETVVIDEMKWMTTEQKKKVVQAVMAIVLEDAVMTNTAGREAGDHAASMGLQQQKKQTNGDG